MGLFLIASLFYSQTERIVLVPFSDEDKASYDVLESEALSFYKDFKATHRTELSKHYLKLITKLLPLRTACAGGRIPLLDADGNEDHHDENGDDAEDEEEAPRKRKKVQKYTEYAYTSKLKKLVSELEHIRDSDPTSKSLVFSQFTSTLKWLQEELPKHGFQFRTLSGDMTMKKRAKALSDFQNDPPTTIFLLSMRYVDSWRIDYIEDC
jgi:SNF2 family DNA or RNA helicase